MSGRGEVSGKGDGSLPGGGSVHQLLSHHAGLVAFFRCRLPAWRRAEAEDLAQSTLVAAWVRLRSAEEEQIQDLPRFLLGIARHKLLDEYSRAATQKTDTFDPVLLDGFPARMDRVALERRQELDQLRSRLRRALRRIRRPDRDLLLLRYHEGLSHADACRRLQITPEDGSRLIYRARQKLRFLLRASRPAGGDLAPASVLAAGSDQRH